MSHVPVLSSRIRPQKELLWHAQTFENVLTHFSVRQEGLSEKEAEERSRRFGLNIIPDPPQATALLLLVRQLKSPFTLILGIAAAVSWKLNDYLDAWFIAAAALVNVVFGFVQEWRAERSLQALQKVIHDEATVIREDDLHRVPTEKLVPGDIIFVSAGERVPADARLIDLEMLEVNEASLTGESAAVRKTTDSLAIGTFLGDRANIIFAGTAVTRGEAKAVVVATGAYTEIGKIAQSITAIPDEETPLEERLRNLSRRITTLVLALGGIVFLVGLAVGHPILEIFTTAAAVAVAAVPEGLVVSVTIILVLGMSRLVRQGALVRRLRAAETLGSITVLCVDKTGTITEGKMRVVEVLPTAGDGEEEKEHLLHIGILANEAWLEETERNPHEPVEIVGESTDVAILAAGLAGGLHEEIDARRETVRERLPFSSENQFSAALADLRDRDQRVIAVKGAAEKLLPASTHVLRGKKEELLSPQERGALMRQHNEFSSRGMRLIALAQRHVAKNETELPQAEGILSNLTFLGLVALEDPIRSDVPETFQELRKAGIRLFLITGDHVLTAQAVAARIGMEAKDVMNGEMLDKISDAELSEKLTHDVIFARTAPQHKLRIVDVLRKRGEVVAMTGDGINDALALKASDIGVALGSGTDVAKKTADLVLLNDALSTVLQAVREGRAIFDNIRKVVVLLLTDTFSEVILVLGSLLFGLPLALVATQILFMNLIGDSLPMYSLALEPPEKDSMRRPPRPRRESILNREALVLILGVGLISDFFLLGLYIWMLNHGVTLDIARTIIFATVALDTFVEIFTFRNLRIPIWKINFFSNPWLLAAVSLGVGGIVAAVHVPFLQHALHTTSLDARGWGFVAILSLSALLPIEFVKFLVRRIPALQH